MFYQINIVPFSEASADTEPVPGKQCISVLLCICLRLLSCRACGLWLRLCFSAQMLILFNCMLNDKMDPWSGYSHMETFLFSHNILSTLGAICVLNQKSKIYHSVFLFQALVNVTGNSRNFLLSLILSMFLTDSSAPALPAVPILHWANNHLVQTEEEKNSLDPQILVLLQVFLYLCLQYS